ncbi:MAG: dihydrofolate synthase/folylpolyglutamate synthase [Planctomycetota bacterium]|jgi:dihydrofolate synthase/folylpolyglutamate synthase
MDPAANRLAPLLDRMVDYERLRPTEREWDLSGVERLLRRKHAAVPVRPAIQVAGSKGKGTTAAFLEAIGSAAGLRTGSYSSPHLITLCERIRIAGEPIRVECLQPVLAGLLDFAGDQPPTFFEAMTVAAVECFAQDQVDLAIYEVGLGGRFDATTAIDVDAAIVTRIELEHTDVLGDTIAAIAGEKAAVIRSGGLGLTATTGEALAVIRAHAERVGAELLVMGEDFGVHHIDWADDGARGLLSLPDGTRQQFFLPDAKAFELPALALAVAALSRLHSDLKLPLDPVPRPNLPCRFEVRTEADGGVLILDGAHTEDSLQAVVVEVQRRYPGTTPRVLTSLAAGKRWQEALSAVLPIADSFVVTELTGTPGEDPAKICAWLTEQGARSEVATDVASGLRKLREHPGPRLVVGSFYLAGAVRLLVDSHA